VPSRAIRLIFSRISILFRLFCKVAFLSHILEGHFLVRISDIQRVEHRRDMLCTVSLTLKHLLLQSLKSW